MKTTSISVRRNYHLSNDDSYAKGEWSLSGELDDADDVQKCFERLSDELDAAFKKRYPHVRTYLNFEEVIQVEKADVWDGFVQSNKIKSNFDEVKFENGGIGYIPKNNTPEKTNKGTIEEQSEWYTQEDAVENTRKEISKVKFKGILEKVYAPLVKKLYPQLQSDYDLRLEQLTQIEIPKQTV